MRRSGKTTRLIDEVIQHLFEKGTLYLVTKQASYLIEKIPGIPDSELIFTDPDCRKDNMAQQDFIRRVLKRLHSEHSEFIEVKKEKFYFKVTKK